MELRLDVILGKKIFDAGHIKCSRRLQAPHPYCNATNSDRKIYPAKN